MYPFYPRLCILHCDILNCDILNVKLFNYFQRLHVWSWIYNSKRWDENIDDGNKEYCDYCEVIDAVSFPNLSFLFNIVAAIDNQSNTYNSLFTNKAYKENYAKET